MNEKVENENPDEKRARRLEKLRHWRKACAEEGLELKSYNLEPGCNPLLLFHGDFDMGGVYVRKLANDCAHPLIAFAPHGMNDDNVKPSIEWMARERLADIFAVRPTGPYRLAGYCNGALVAYECARLLLERGCKVEFVIMIEPSSLNARPGYRLIHRALSSFFAPPAERSDKAQEKLGVIMRKVWNVGRVAHLSPAEIAALARTMKERRLKERQRLAEDLQSRSSSEKQLQERYASLIHVYTAALASYVPQPSTVPVVVLSTGRDGQGRQCGLYDGKQWGRLARNFRHIQMPGHHSTCLSVHAGELVANLRTILAAHPAQAV